MTSPLDPISPEVASLLDEERLAPGLPAPARVRLRERLGALGPVPLAPDHGGEPTDAGAARGTATSGSVAAAKAAIASKVGVAAIAFGVGSVTGAAGHAAFGSGASARPPVVAEASSATASVAPAVVRTGPQDAGPLVVTPAPDSPPRSIATVAARAPAETPPTPQDSLKHERASLEVARTAITRRDFGAALSALERHAREFPRGQLAEERETLKIQALVGQGRHAEAREQAERFRHNFPESLMQGAVDVAIRSTIEQEDGSLR